MPSMRHVHHEERKVAIDLETIKDCLDVFNTASVTFGIVAAVILYSKNQFEASYEKLNDKYLNFLQMQASNPGLGTSTSDRILVPLKSDSKSWATRELIFEYLCSLLERAFLFLNTGIDCYFPWKSREWITWDEWVSEYGKNPNFVQFWKRKSVNPYYSKVFVQYLNSKLNINPL